MQMPSGVYGNRIVRRADWRMMVAISEHVQPAQRRAYLTALDSRDIAHVELKDRVSIADTVRPA